MELEALASTLASIIFVSTPLVYATLGETLTERSGVVNLSLDGSLLLAAMAGFAGAYLTGSVLAGFAAAAAVGALVALVVAVAGISLRLNQIAVGFVLTLLAGDLSSFLGNPFVRLPGPSVPHQAIPVLSGLPLVGRVLFDQDLLVYGSFVLTAVVWFWLYQTQPGLRLQGTGEHPAAAFARGTSVNRLRYIYTVLGGALVGVAGAAYSLDVRLGWSHRMTAGVGWIALSIVIFGGWNPLRVVLGAYLFGALTYLGIRMQAQFPGMPTEVFTVAPFPLMIVALLIVNSDAVDRLLALLPPGPRHRLRAAIRSRPPAALGTTFEEV
jgi:simple sugar transport system permease protein